MTSEHQSAAKGSPSAITVGVSIISHLLLLLPVIYVLVLAFSNYSFFSWHPICMALGVGLLITEAVMSISGEAYLAHHMPRRTRVTIHWILHTVGLTLLTIGLVIIVVNKNWFNKHHFATTHAQFGITTLVFTYVTSAFGILANNTKWLYPKVRPVLLKVVHAFGGIFVTILLLATVINGTYTKWWPGSDVGRSLVFTSFFIAGTLILVKPILGAVSRSRVICGPSNTDT